MWVDFKSRHPENVNMVHWRIAKTKKPISVMDVLFLVNDSLPYAIEWLDEATFPDQETQSLRSRLEKLEGALRKIEAELDPDTWSFSSVTKLKSTANEALKQD